MRISRDEHLRRRRSLRRHILIVLGTLLLLIPFNFATNPSFPWWLWVLMAWMPLIAAHTAWAMGLFDRTDANADAGEEGS